MKICRRDLSSNDRTTPAAVALSVLGHTMLHVEFCLHTFPFAGRPGRFPSLRQLANGFGTTNIARRLHGMVRVVQLFYLSECVVIRDIDTAVAAHVSLCEPFVNLCV